MTSPNTPATTDPRLPPGTAAASHPLQFTALSGGQREVRIEHAGQLYRLSLTAQNKLILTK